MSLWTRLEENRIKRQAMKAIRDPEVLALMRQDPQFSGLFNDRGELDAIELPPLWRRKTGWY